MSSLPPWHWGYPSVQGDRCLPWARVLAHQPALQRNKVGPEVLLGTDLLPDLQSWQENGFSHPLALVSHRQWLLQSLWTRLVRPILIYSPQKEKNGSEDGSCSKHQGEEGQPSEAAWPQPPPLTPGAPAPLPLPAGGAPEHLPEGAVPRPTACGIQPLGQNSPQAQSPARSHFWEKTNGLGLGYRKRRQYWA